MSSSHLQNGCVEYWSWDRKDQQTDVIFQGGCNPSMTFNKDEMIYGTNALNSDWHYWEVKVKNTVRNRTLFESYEKILLGVVGRMLRHHRSWTVNTDFLNLYQHRVVHVLANHYPRKLSTSHVIGMFFDRQQGTLSYYNDGELIGLAHRGLEHVKDELFPVIASTNGIELTLGKRLRNYHTLQDRCRGTILKELLYKSRNRPDTDLLPLPTRLKDFVNSGLW